jgi:hypothetical protein
VRKHAILPDGTNSTTMATTMATRIDDESHDHKIVGLASLTNGQLYTQHVPCVDQVKIGNVLRLGKCVVILGAAKFGVNSP